MPVTRSRTYLADLSLDNGLDGNNTTGFLFGDEDSNLGEVKTYTQAGISDNFPTLVRREGFPNMVSCVLNSLLCKPQISFKYFTIISPSSLSSKQFAKAQSHCKQILVVLSCCSCPGDQP